MPLTGDWQTTQIGRIGNGEAGGKAAGLIRICDHLNDHFPDGWFSNIRVRIPRMTVLTTSFFDAFMQQNNLFEIAASEMKDARIAAAFQRADIPYQFVGELRTLSNQATAPLAIRSSSLLEDAASEPFAGVYQTKMIPNNQPSADDRFARLVEAVKFVIASTFFSAPKAYLQFTGRSIEDEKMAVIIQEVVGRRYGDAFYPVISGVARSWNYYPFGHGTRNDGVVDLALGMGKTIADGGVTWSYCPAFPKSPPPYNDVRDMLQSTQTSFWAVHMGQIRNYNPLEETEYMASLPLSTAEYHNTLRHVASTYVASADRIVPGIGRQGPRLVNFWPVLTTGEPPLNDLLQKLLQICKEVFSGDVDMEFAMAMDRDTADFGFLQVRPMLTLFPSDSISDDELQNPDALVASDHVLGCPSETAITDVVYVRPESFHTSHTRQIALDIARINKTCLQEGRSYLLIGFGRWGTSDDLSGIPVTWDQVSRAKIIVEAVFPGLNAEMSQGSHFFHNLSSFQVSYFSAAGSGYCKVDFSRLDAQEEVSSTRFVRHIRIDNPLVVRVDTARGRGVITYGTR